MQQTPVPALPAPQLARVPDTAPPYDGEIHAAPGQHPRDAAGADVLALARPAPAVALPDGADAATAQTRQFAQAIIETVAGTRPFRQVTGWTTERVQGQIRGLIPLLRTDGEPRIRRILASRTSPDAVEVTVIAGFGPRTRALAMRFEHVPARASAPGLPPRPARWLCTDIETA